MALPFYNWSRTAASNATADSTVNWQEGMAPSAVNDSARAMMASTAAFRDDISGAIATGGTSTAYTVSSYQVFDSLSHLDGKLIAFTPHTTNGATVTLNVDGLGAKPLRSAPSTELVAGVLVQGTPYAAVYNSSDSAFYLHGFFNNPYTVPIGSSIDFWGSTAPNSSFVLMYGQAISRTTYSALFAMFSTTYGVGDGSSTFNIPDLRGCVVAGKGDMGGVDRNLLNSSFFGASGTTLGAFGGAQSLTLTAAQIPTITAATSGAVSVFPGSGAHVPVLGSAGTIGNAPVPTTGGATVPYNSAANGNLWTSVDSFSTSVAVSVTSNNTSGNAHRTVQPTVIANKLLRII